MNKLRVTALFVLGILSLQSYGQQVASFIDNDPDFQEYIPWMKSYTEGLVESNRGELDNGTTVFFADKKKHYNLIFTRGFAYIYQFAGKLIKHEDAKSFLEYQLAGQRADGCMPDRVNSEGLAIYSPGSKDSPLADHAMDNGAFIASSVYHYVKNSNDLDFFKKHEPALRRGMDFINRAPNGLVFNKPENPQCVYGFTDIVKKTGYLLFTSVLYYDACLQLEELSRKTGVGDAEQYASRAKLIKENIGILWDKHSGAYYAASDQCHQYDVWGTAFVLNHPGLATAEQEKRALDFLEDNYSRYVEKGQIRHLLEPEVWESTFVYRAAGVYQNGAYWATPLAWYIPVIAKRDPDLASQTLKDCLQDFQKRGIYEWVNGGVKVLPDYFVSAASVYSLLSTE